MVHINTIIVLVIQGLIDLINLSNTGIGCFYTCSKHLLHNKFSKRIYPGPTRPLSRTTRTQPTWLFMPSRTQAQLSNKLLIQAINATQGNKTSYPTSYYQPGHNPPGSKCHTGHQRSFPTSYHQPGHNPPGSKCHTGTHIVAIQQTINPGNKCYTGTQAYALNATQGHSCSYPESY